MTRLYVNAAVLRSARVLSPNNTIRERMKPNAFSMPNALGVASSVAVMLDADSYVIGRCLCADPVCKEPQGNLFHQVQCQLQGCLVE